MAATANMQLVSGGAETHFAKKLASNEKTVRDKAVKKLRMWLSSSRFVSSGLSETDLLKLWKGLFYCMWMSDKSKVQEELAETIAQLLHNFHCENSAFEFLGGFFKTMVREWHGIDRLRLDKFYLLIRKFIYQSIIFLKNHDWDEETVSQLNRVLENGPLNPTSESVQIASGVKVHVIQVYLDELFKIDCRKIASSTILKLLEPFSRLLAISKSHVITRTISQNMFNQLLEKKENNKDDSSSVKVDFSGLAEQFFSLASRKDIQGRNRNILYVYISKFKKASCIATDRTEIKEEHLNGAKLPSAVNGEEQVLEKEDLMTEACSDDLVGVVDQKVCSKNNEVKKVKEKRIRKRKSDKVSENPVDVAGQTKVELDGGEKSGRNKRRKSDRIRNSVEIIEAGKGEPDEEENKKKKRKKKKNKGKNETIANNSCVDAKNVDNIVEVNQVADEMQLIQEETNNLDGSYLSTIPIPKLKALRSETVTPGTGIQHGDGATDTGNVNPVTNMSNNPAETLSSTSNTTVTTVRLSNQPDVSQGLKEVNAETNSPPLASFLRHSLKKINTEPRKKKERKSPITSQCNSAPGNGRKQVRIQLSKNTSHTTQDYHRSLHSSPVIPYDATKKPVQSSLRTPPAENIKSVLNNSGRQLRSLKRPSAADFF